jgi:hypothetical protein
LLHSHRFGTGAIAEGCARMLDLAAEEFHGGAMITAHEARDWI